MIRKVCIIKMVKSAVHVAIRTRPTANFASKNLKLDLEKKTIEVFIPKDNSQGMINLIIFLNKPNSARKLEIQI